MYKISEFCMMVGLPKSRIRFYEKCGLLTDHQAENGYRYYTHYDAFRVNAFLNLVQLGFTVENAIAMLDRKQSGEEFAGALENQKASIERQIRLLEYRRDRIGDTLDRIRSDPSEPFETRVVEPLLYVNASDGLDFSPSRTNARMIEKFYSIMAVARCSRIIRREDLLGGGDNVDPSYVIAIPESASHLLGDYDRRAVKRMELGRCLVYYRNKTRQQSARKDSYAPLLERLEAQGLSARGDILLVPFFLNLDGQGLDIEEVIVPV